MGWPNNATAGDIVVLTDGVFLCVSRALAARSLSNCPVAALILSDSIRFADFTATSARPLL